MGVTWRGSRKMVEQPTSPQIDRGEKDQVRRVFAGPYAVVKANMPKRGDVMQGFPGVEVDTVTLARVEPDVGMMTVTAVGEVGTEDDPNDPTPLSTLREIEWTPFSRPLGTAPGFYGVVEHDAIGAWDREPNAALRKAFKYEEIAITPEGFVTGRQQFELNAVGKVLAERMLKGVTSWIDYTVVARVIRIYRKEPPTERCGKIETPTFFKFLPAGYEFRRSADAKRERDDRTWVRTTEWSGVEGEWDKGIYGAGG